MAYSRWGQGSDWYIFWETTPAAVKADETVAIWNSDVRDRTFSATYREVVAMLSSGDFSSIPGYSRIIAAWSLTLWQRSWMTST